MKLYKVTCRGMTSGLGSAQAYGVAYVVADDPERAYRTVRAALDTRDLGFTDDREMRSVELIAEDAPYPSCGTVLYLDAYVRANLEPTR